MSCSLMKQMYTLCQMGSDFSKYPPGPGFARVVALCYYFCQVSLPYFFAAPGPCPMLKNSTVCIWTSLWWLVSRCSRSIPHVSSISSKSRVRFSSFFALRNTYKTNTIASDVFSYLKFFPWADPPLSCQCISLSLFLGCFQVFYPFLIYFHLIYSGD